MTKTKSTKRALLSSVLALVVCIAMLVGSTFAWFTDNASTAVNQIVAGNLDIVLEYQKADGSWDNAEGLTLEWVKAAGAENEAILWEPGCTYKLPALRVRNEGNLALKYTLIINGVIGDAGLLKVIDFTANDQPISNFNGKLYAKGETDDTSDAIVIKGHMQETAGNEYQGLTLSGISVAVFATQLNYENDSYGPDYDKTATYAAGSTSELEDLLKLGGKITLEKDITVDKPITVPAGSTAVLDLNGKTLSGTVDKASGAVIDNKGTLTITGGTVENTTVNGGATINNTGTMTLEDVEVIGAPIAQDAGYPSYCISNSGNLTVEEGTSVTADRGCLSVSGTGKTVINGGTFTNNDLAPKLATGRSFTSHVVVVGYGANNKLTINGGTFKHLHTSTSGGVVINNWSAVTVEVNGGNFSGGNYFGKWDNLSDYGYGSTSKPFSVKGGTFTGLDKNYVADGHIALDNGDGTFTVVEGVAVSGTSGLKDTIANGEKAVLTEDVTDFATNITNDADINLAGNTLALSGSDLKVTGDLAVSGGTVDVTSGYFDLRSTDNKEIVFENVVFTNSKKSLTYGNSTDRVEPAIEFCPEAAGVESTIVFKNCTFNNANVVFEAMSGKNGAINAVFENCTFNNLGNSDAIEISNYLTVNITVKNCNFNMVATSNICIIDALGSSDVTVTFEGTNTVYGESAVATDASLAGTVDEIRVFSTQSVKVASAAVDHVNGLDTVTVSGIATK